MTAAESLLAALRDEIGQAIGLGLTPEEMTDMVYRINDALEAGE